MTDTIRSRDDLLALFADNVIQDISPQDMRDLIVSLLGVDQSVGTNSAIDFTTGLVELVDLTDTISLPLVGDYKKRSLTIKNISGHDVNVNAAPTEFIEGLSFFVMEDGDSVIIYPSLDVDDNWLFVISPGMIGPQGDEGIQGIQGDEGTQGQTGIQGPTGPTGLKGDKGDTGIQGIKGFTGDPGPSQRIIQLVATRLGNVNQNHVLKIGEVNHDDSGYVIPKTGNITTVSIGQRTANVNGVIGFFLDGVNTFNITSAGGQATVEDGLSFPVVAGEVLKVINNSAIQMQDVIVSVLVEF